MGKMFNGWKRSQMNNTTYVKQTKHTAGIWSRLRGFALGLVLLQAFAVSAQDSVRSASSEEKLSAKQIALVPIAAFTATGNLTQLNAALRRGLDAGLTVSETKETLVQMYAYAGFPRSLNALNELMTVLSERSKQGIKDAPGVEPAPVPTGAELLAMGTANQTKLVGAPVKGALFDFAPVIDYYLKAHLFGDMFSRDNLDWRSRELATVGALSAMTGTESQLQSHMRFSMNVGLTEKQLREVVATLGKDVDAGAGQRADAALRHVVSATK
jgi:4-carboxymuconolactone decarboxylase